MSDFNRLLISICFSIATVVYVMLFKRRIKEGFNVTIHPIKGMDKVKEECGNQWVGLMKGTTSFLMFWLAVKCSLYSVIFVLYSTYELMFKNGT